MTIYFDKDKNPSNYRPDNCLCQISDAEWAYFSEHPDEWDIIRGKFKDLRSTKAFQKNKIAEAKEEFHKNFFETSQGFIRRKVTMADGSIKDFLTDLLHGIEVAVNNGQQVNIFAYDEPDFNNLLPIETYQHEVIVTPELLQEFLVQLGKDFVPTLN